jgi:tetratricopeptide (TPR) repeat protein
VSRPRARIALARVVLGVAMLLAAGCGPSPITETPVLPRLDDMEPAVGEKIRATHGKVTAEPTAANWARYARVLHAHDLVREAVDPYVVAAAHTEMPEKFELLYLGGHAAYKPDPDRAIGLFEQAAALRSDYPALYLRLGALQEAAQRWDEAERAYRKADEINARERKRGSDALAGLGRVQLARGRTAEAIALLEKARTIDPEHSEVHASLASAYARAGRKDDSARESLAVGNLEDEHTFPDPIASAMRQEGVSFSCLESLGIAAERAGEFQMALGYFERAAAVRPDSVDVQLEKGRALSALGRYVEAEPLLDRVLAARPDSPTALSFKAGCAMARKDLQSAVAYFNRALAIDPHSLHVRWNLGRTLHVLGNREEAKKHFIYILERKPHRADVRLELATTLAEDGKTSDAAAQVDLVLASDPGNAKALALREQLGR